MIKDKTQTNNKLNDALADLESQVKDIEVQKARLKKQISYIKKALDAAANHQEKEKKVFPGKVVQQSVVIGTEIDGNRSGTM